MSSPTTVFVPDAVTAPHGASMLRAARAGDTSGTLVETELSQLRGRLAARDVRLDVVELDDGDCSLALAALAEDWDHTSVAVADLDSAIDFYGELLGFEVDFCERGMDAQIASITGVAGLVCDLAQLSSAATVHTLELIAFRRPPNTPEDHGPLRPGQGHVGFRVRDLDAALEQVRRLGGVLIGEVTGFESGRSAYCRSASGSYIELSEPGSASTPPPGKPARRP